MLEFSNEKVPSENTEPGTGGETASPGMTEKEKQEFNKLVEAINLIASTKITEEK